MASEVDNWTDVEIREKFELMGSPAPPVTATTRKFMVNRIKKHMQNGGKSLPKPHEEEIDDDDEPDALPLPPTRIPRRLGRSALAALNESQNPQSSRPSMSPAERSPSRIPISPIERVEAHVSKENRPKSPGRKSLGRASDFHHTPDQVEEIPRPTRKLTPGRRTQDTEEFIHHGGISPGRFSSGAFAQREAFEPRRPAESIVPGSFVANDVFRSRLIDASSTDSFESDFMKKISTPPSRSLYSGNDDVLSDDEDAINSPVRIVRGNKSSGYEVRSGKKGRFFPVALFFTFLIPFTVLLASFVLFYSGSNSGVAVPKIIFPACSGSSVDVPGFTCIDQVDRIPVESLFKALNEGLTQTRLDAPCTTSHNQPIFIGDNSVKEIIVNNNEELSVWLVEKKLKDLKIMVDANPFLNLKSNSDGISLVKGPDTFACFLWSKIVLLAEWIIKIGVTTMLAVLVYVGVKWQLSSQQKFKEDVSTAVDKVLDLVKTRRYVTMEQAEKELTSSGFSADVISEALNSAAQDSRVNLDSKSNIAGFRWVGETTATLTDKLWGSDRGEVEQIGTYVLPLTACLKIRGMFSPSKKIMSDDDVRHMVDAILEKSIGNRIVHVVVDRQSPDGIVYLRGLTKADAGGVFRRLNGTLFDGQRVSVKYVRETRYEEKFPDSGSYTRPIRASSQK